MYIPVMVHKLATGQFAEVPHPTGRPQDERNSSVHSNPLPLEDIPNTPVRWGVPWPNSGSAPQNLFELRKDMLIPPTPIHTPAPTIKKEAPLQVAVIPHVMVRLKEAMEGCSWGPNCPFCKNEEEHDEDWDSNMQKEQPRMWSKNTQHPQPQNTQSPQPQNTQCTQPQNMQHPQSQNTQCPSHRTIRTPSHLMPLTDTLNK